MNPLQRSLVIGALAVSLAVAVLVGPPQPLAEWLPERSWQVAVVTAGVFLGLLALLAILDIVPLKVTVFGSKVEAAGDGSPELLTRRLESLQIETREMRDVVSEAVDVLEDMVEIVTDLQRRVDALELRDTR